jgi:UDPglucose 6-dehydrogenase
MTPRVAVVGLWHLGCTTAGCLAAAGFPVVGTDPDAGTVSDLQLARVPVEEPGLSELVRAALAAGALTFTHDGRAAVADADVVWVCFDTPVNERDEADVAWVRDQIESLLPHLRDGTVVLVSSQVPVGFTRALRESTKTTPTVRFAYSPENLRLGHAIESFRRPVRTVVGTETGAADATIAGLLAPFGGDVLWMTLESAEMAKHALNAFLAVSVAFINEVARVCEPHGADAKEVERALKSEPRIGPRAYLSPGPAFAGGTLARDLRALEQLGVSAHVRTPLVCAVLESNAEQSQWLHRTLQAMSGELRGRRIGVLGLAYKPGTNTLRRSSALELCQWLAQRGAEVRAHDPAVAALPSGTDARIHLVGAPLQALSGAEVGVVATPWPEYRQLTPADVLAHMTVPRIIDQARFLADTLGADPRIHYRAVGTPHRRAGAR